MTNFLQTSIEHPATITTLGIFLAATALETVRTIADSRKSTVAGVDSYPSDEGPSYIFVGGRGQNQEELGPIYHRRFKGMGSEHYPFQRGKQYSQEATDDAIAQACERDGDRERVFVLTSMGTMEGMRSLLLPQTRAAIGKANLRAIALLSPLTSKADLQPYAHDLLDKSLRTPALPIVNNLHAGVRLLSIPKDISRSEGTQANEARRHHRSTALMPFKFVKSQDRIIDETEPWEMGSHLSVTEENPGLELHMITANFDSIVDREASERHIAESFGLSVQTEVDTRRKHGSHADDIEFMEPLIGVVSRFSGLNRRLGSSAQRLDYLSEQPQLARI